MARWWNRQFTDRAIERDFGTAVDGDEQSEDYIAVVDGSRLA